MPETLEPKRHRRWTLRAGFAPWGVAVVILLAAIWGTVQTAKPSGEAAVTPRPPSAVAPAAVATPVPPLYTAAQVRDTPQPARSPATPQATPTLRPSRYWVRFGPTEDIGDIEALVDGLSRSYGVVGRILTSQRANGFRVATAPVRLRGAAEERRGTFAAIGIQATVVSGDDAAYHLDFGVFDDRLEAEARAREIRRRGYSARVEPNLVPVYTVVVGPASERVALAIVRTLRAAVPDGGQGSLSATIERGR